MVMSDPMERVPGRTEMTSASMTASRRVDCEAGERERQRVRPGIQVDDAVLSCAVGDDGPDLLDEGGVSTLQR